MNTFRKLFVGLIFVVCLGIPPYTQAQTTSSSPPPMTWEATVEVNLNVFITENVGKSHHPESGWTRISTGSGTIFDGDRGLVLTNNHVIEDSLKPFYGQLPRITVVLQPNSTNYRLVYAGYLVGRDPVTDLAVLKLIDPFHPDQFNGMGLPQVTFGDSSFLNIGDPVSIIGNPLGVGKSISEGVVSALNRGMKGHEELIQTDAAMNPGNSGGGVFDITGKLVGIPISIISDSHASAGVGFFIPINVAEQEIGQLIFYHRVLHAQLGIHIYMPNSLFVVNGVEVADVDPHSAASKAGLKIGDVIIRMNFVEIFVPDDILNFMTKAKPNDKVIVSVYRNHKEIQIPVILDQAPFDDSVESNDDN